LSPLQDWESEAFADPSRQAWLVKISSPLGAACPIDQPEEGKNVIFEAASDGTDGTERQPLSMDYYRG
jgi:hypothetical protein